MIDDFATTRIMQIKRDKLVDVLRRVVANPGTIEEVAEEIALDWCPTILVARDGTCDVLVGSGKKR